MTAVTVDLHDLRCALAAVMPHVASMRQAPSLARVRITPQAQNLELSATDRFTIGLGLVSIWEHDDTGGDATVVDLYASDVAKILAVHHEPGKNDDAHVRIATSEDMVTITDVSGLLEGEALALERVSPSEMFPDLRKPFATSLRAGHSLKGEFWLNAPLMRRFESAQKAYGHPLVFEPTRRGGALVVRCGDSFLGMLSLVRPDEDAQHEANRWADDWSTRIAPGADPVAWEEFMGSIYRSVTAEEDARAAKSDDVVDTDMVCEAAVLVVRAQFASTSMLQRKLRVGFVVAGKMIDRLEEAGVVGPPDGSKAREVHIAPEHLGTALTKVRELSGDDS